MLFFLAHTRKQLRIVASLIACVYCLRILNVQNQSFAFVVELEPYISEYNDFNCGQGDLQLISKAITKTDIAFKVTRLHRGEMIIFRSVTSRWYPVTRLTFPLHVIVDQFSLYQSIVCF